MTQEGPPVSANRPPILGKSFLILAGGLLCQPEGQMHDTGCSVVDIGGPLAYIGGLLYDIGVPWPIQKVLCSM